MSLVCIDCRYVNGRPSGIAEMIMALVEHVPAMAPDLRFRLLVSRDAPGLLSAAPNVEQVPVRAAANGPGTMWWLPQLADLRGVDLFHATFNIMPAGLGIPTITTIHDLMWLTQPQLCESGWRCAVRQPFFAHGIKRALDRSTVIATVSEATRDAVLASRPDAAARTFVTRSGVSGAFQSLPPDPDALAALGLDPRRRFVLTVGQNAPYKNHTGAIEAFALACAGRDDLDLVLVQRQGPRADALLKQAASLGLEGRVHIIRGLGLDHLVQLYSMAAMLLHPSFCEGFGNPLAEAMACGCPVVTGDRSAMAEVTQDAALQVDPGNPLAIAAAIGRVLDDPQLARELGRLGRKRAAELQWEQFASANLALYRSILGTKNAIPPVRRPRAAPHGHGPATMQAAPD